MLFQVSRRRIVLIEFNQRGPGVVSDQVTHRVYRADLSKDFFKVVKASLVRVLQIGVVCDGADELDHSVRPTTREQRLADSV